MNERALQEIVAKFGVSSLTIQAISFAGSDRVTIPTYGSTPKIPADKIGRTPGNSVADVFAIFGGGAVVHLELRCEHCGGESVPEWRRNGKIIWRTWPDGRPGEWACHYCGRAA
jgi:hypothetical protein